jgi:DNA polymerase I
MRQGTKKTNFGVVYGIGDEKLGRQLGIDQFAAGRLKQAYFRTYPGNDHWLSVANFQARTQLYARTASGRIQRFNHDGSRGQIAAVGRNGQNMPIQGTSADMLKRALYLLDIRLRGTSGIVVNIVHDEIVCEADAGEAEMVRDILVDSMEEAGREYISVVPVLVEAKIADAWLK